MIAANLVPVYGVLFLEWKVFPIILLFWLENVVIGGFNVFRMLAAQPESPETGSKTWLAKSFLVPFFCLHYGLFALGHGLFVMVVFGGAFAQNSPFFKLGSVPRLVREFHLEWALLGLALSHAVSFFADYLGKKEYRQADLSALMRQPYGRVVVLHLTIMGTGYLLTLIDSPLPGLLLLVGLKIVLDVRAHLRQGKPKGSLPPDRQDTAL